MVMFLDTETPGFRKPLVPIEVATVKVDKIGQILHKAEVWSHQMYSLAPDRSMELGALSVHNILPEELIGQPRWNPAIFWNDKRLGVQYLVGHNVDFDWEVIGKPDVPRICTLALSRLLARDLDAHRLSAMMYYLFGMTTDTRRRVQNAHSAVADLTNCYAVFVEICKRLSIETWEQAHQHSERGRVPHRLTFGKHGPKDGKPGVLIRDLLGDASEKGYVRWLLGGQCEQVNNDPYLKRALMAPPAA